MIIRCYGARGSIAVSGAEYLKYGGDTTCIEIRTKNDEIIIVDAGSGIRRLGNKLLSEDRFEYSIIFTHSHLDHIIGFPFFKPVSNERATIDLLGCPITQGNIRKLLSRAMEAPLFPVAFDELKAKINYSGECALSFQVDTVEVFPINLSHPNVGMGYKFVEDGKTFVFLTDNELGYRHREGRSFEEYVEFSRDADFLIHDAMYTQAQYETTKTWGHSTYNDALNLALAARVKRFGLFHHDHGRDDDKLDVIVQVCRKVIQKQKRQMECFALSQTTELTL
jgi:phosphoribosyl 1,2-cyclic phosphodiesterase